MEENTRTHTHHTNKPKEIKEPNVFEYNYETEKKFMVKLISYNER